MQRRYIIPIVCTLLYVVCGIAFGVLWYAMTGRADMPWWIAVLLVGVAGLVSDMVEETVRHRRARRVRPDGLPRHRKEPVS
jgi:hypothetical protein